MIDATERIVTIFGGSKCRESDFEYSQAMRVGELLAGAGFTVCTGGYSGVMEAVSRGAKQAGGRTIAITSTFFRTRANEWVDEEHAASSWQERLFELIRFGEGYVACKGGTGTLVELAVVWEMLNKGVMAGKPFITLGDFWGPIVERVREVEVNHGSRWAEAKARLVHSARNPAEAADYLAQALAQRR